MTTSSSAPPGRTGRIVVIAWLLLVTAFAAVIYAALSDLRHQVVTQSNDAQIADLQNRLNSAEDSLETLKKQPAPVNTAGLAAVRQALDERLAKVEQSFSDTTRTEELALLHSRLKAVEVQTGKVTRALASRSSATTPASSTASEPPFSVLGIEMRGGERVLAVMPAGSNSLAQTRLLRMGDTQDNWRLEGLTGNAADFRVDGRAQRIVVQ